MWVKSFKVNPLLWFKESDDNALIYWVDKDLLGANPGNIESLWKLPTVKRILGKQHPDGFWQYKGNRPGDAYGENYELLQTWKTFRILVEKYGMTREHKSISCAAEFLFSCQTDEGDIRGILSNQYTPYYMGAMLEILIKAGYAQDKRVEEGFRWLLSIRQNDGGWIIPMNMFKMQDYQFLCQGPPIQPDKELPFSHAATGMVIRAFAAHPEYKKSNAAIQAGKLLKNRFFEKDTFSSRQGVSFWFKFQYPFWWTDLLTCMDSLMRLEFSTDDDDIQKAIGWFINNQTEMGGWRSAYGKSDDFMADKWVSLAICRVIKYFLSS
jgi:hypothetical protein